MKRGSNSGASMRTGKTPSRHAADARKRAREEARWAARSGPVRTYHVDPETLR